MTFDIGVTFMLTGLFFWLLRPVLSFHGMLNMMGWRGRTSVERGAQNTGESEIKSVMHSHMKTLLWRNLIGSALVMLPTATNMVQIYLMKGRELGWVCLTICTIDSTYPHSPTPPLLRSRVK